MGGVVARRIFLGKAAFVAPSQLNVNFNILDWKVLAKDAYIGVNAPVSIGQLSLGLRQVEVKSKG